MAFRTWGRLLLTAFGVSVLAGAGQLGIAYGFGIVRLTGTFTDGSVNRWPAQLVWVGWFAAVAAVAGAVLTARLARRLGLPGGTGEQLAVAGAAALGATVVAPLCMQPARAAQLGTVDPVWAVGICAILGAVIGAGAALAVLLSPPLGWNIALTAGAIWLLALISVAPSLAATGPLPTVRLGVLEPSWLHTGTAQRAAMLILPTVALIAGAVVGALARGRGHAPVVGGAAGAAGPVLVAFAYLTAGPGDAADRYQLAPYYGALIAVAAGALGSTAVTALRRSTPAPATNAIEPTDILQPLPAGPTRSTGASGSTGRTGSGLAVTGPGAAGTPTTAGSASTTAADPGLFPTDRGTNPSGGGRPTPAHWDWPEAAPSGTPAPVPTGSARPTGGRHPDHQFPGIPVPPSDDRDPARSAAFGSAVVEERATGADRATGPDRRSSGSAGERGTPTDADVAASGIGRVVDPLVSSLPAPNLPSGRRISAIDVLAAGRTPATPASESRVPPEARTPAPPASETPMPPEAPPPATPESGSASAAAPPARPKRARRPRSTAPAPAEPTIPAPAVGTPADTAPAARNAAPTRETTGASSPAAETTGASSPSAADQRGAAGRPRAAAAGAAVPVDASTATTPDQPDGEPGRRNGDRATARPRSTRRAAPTRRDTTAAAPEPTPADTASSAADVPPAPAAATGRSTTNPPKPAPEPTGTSAGTAPSPRPRYSIFDDGTGQPGDVRPAWPVTPAPTWPTTPRPATRPVDPPPGDTAAPVDPAPRPRHLALPDLGRPPARDTLGDGGEPVIPASDVIGPVWAQHATDTRGERPGARHADDRDQNPAGDGDGDGEEPRTGKSRARRGLFRRNRGRGDEETATDRNDRESEPVPVHDEEYVDWVTGLGRPAETDPEGRPLRTGRHHRD